jgi:uncharacterized protein YhjY with autotransporter beta-barrel domain
MPCARRTKKIATMAAFAVSVVFSSSGQSADFWRGPEGNGSTAWNGSNNWISPNNAIPIATDNVFLQFSSNISNVSKTTVDYVNPNNNPSLGSVSIIGNSFVRNGVTFSSDMTLNQEQDALTASSLLVTGFSRQRGIYNLGGTGSLTVNGGILVGNEGIGVFGNPGTGIFRQNGGTVVTSAGLFGALSIGVPDSTGTYELSGGTLTVIGTTILGSALFPAGPGNGIFIQTGGIHSASAGIQVGGEGSTGTYNQSGGTTNVNNSTLEVGSFAGSTGTYNLSGTGILNTGNTTVGVAGTGVTLSSVSVSSTGTFNQTGGSHNVNGNLTLGQDVGTTGTYNLSGTGSVTVVGQSIVGQSGTGLFNQTGGTHHTIEGLVLGDGVGSNGTYNLSGTGNLTADSGETIGNAGTATFNQTGGTHTVGNTFVLGRVVGSNGTYNLSGTGNLTTPSETIGFGIFNQTGGTNTVGGSTPARSDLIDNGTYNLSGTGILTAGSETVGSFGAGFFNQNGGTNISQFELFGLVGTGTYMQSGGTHIIHSDLTIGEGIFTGSSSSGSYTQTGGNTTVGGSLIFGNHIGANGTYNLSGTGNLTAGSEIIGNGGTGTFNQTGGSHSVTDTLTINSGSIYNLGGGTLNANNLLNNANFNFSGGALAAGQFTNTGIVNLNGAGTPILGGNVTNQGTFNIANTTTAQFTGTFNNVAGGSLSGGQVINGGTLNYSGGTISTNLTNTGTVNLSGAGGRIFDGNITNQGTFKVTDTTAVYNGTFNNEGAYVSDPSVNNFQNLTVGSQGYLTGGPNDTFNVSGNFINNSTQNTVWNTQQSNLVFTGSNGTSHQMALASADLGPNASGFLNNFAWSHVTLNSGNSLVLVDGNSTPGAALYASTFTLGNGVSQLRSVSGNYNVYYDPSLPGNQYLSGNAFNFGSGTGQLIPQGFTFLPPGAGSGSTTNQQGFGAALDSACPSATGVLAQRCRELRVLDSSQRQNAVASLTPIQQLSQVATPIKFNFARMDAPMQRMAQLRSGHVQPASLSVNGFQIPLAKFASSLGSSAKGGAAGDPNAADEPFRDKPFGVFVQGKLDYGSQSNNPQSYGFNIDSRAVTVGTDYRFTDKLVAGAAIEYNNVHTSFNNSGGSMQTDAITGALYSSYYLPKDFYVDGLATVGNSKYALNRTFNYPGFNSSATSSPNALQYAFAVTGGKDIAWRQWLFNPYTRFEYIQMAIDGYQESGGSGFAMNVGSQSVSSAISAVGTQVSYNFSQSWGILVPSARFEWEHQYLNNNQNNSMSIAAATAGTGGFVIQSGQPDRDYVNLGGSLSATLPAGGTAFLRYDTRLGQSYVANHIFEVGVKIPF